MDLLIAWVAQYLPWVMFAGFGLVWLLIERGRGRLQLGLESAVGTVLAVVLLYLAKSMHHDPRPFVDNPHIKPLFHHRRDDGFPSVHSLAASLIAALVTIRHRLLGVPFAAAAVAIAWARVAAHVHHLQDVVVGLLLGGLSAVFAAVIVAPLLAYLHHSNGVSGQSDDPDR
jgi:membrane-associated phospholipid phosphatase